MILVTGATGLIGRSLMAALQREGQAVRPYDGRINNPQALRTQLADVGTVVHLAGSEARGRVRLLNHVDIEGTERLIEECQRAQVSHIIFVSRIGADPMAWQALLKAKGQVERLIQKSGIDYTILRSVSVYGWGDRNFELLVGLAKWSWPLVWLPDGGPMPVQPLWVEDLVRCLLQTIGEPAYRNKVLPVAGSERMSYRQLMQHLLQMTDMRRMTVALPLALVKPLTAVFFRWWFWPAISRFTAERFFVPEIAETDVVYRHFGFHPARISETTSYLNRSGLALRLFRK